MSGSRNVFDNINGVHGTESRQYDNPVKEQGSGGSTERKGFSVSQRKVKCAVLVTALAVVFSALLAAVIFMATQNVDGGWTEWSDWGTCSVTCDAGLKKRNRSCSDPRPSGFGENCLGDSTDVEICLLEKCASTMPFYAFRAHTVSDRALANNKALVFTKTSLNIGDAYNNSTGIFVAPVAGVYRFTAMICMARGMTAYFGFSIDGAAELDVYNGDGSYDHCNSLDKITLVNKGRHVSIKCLSGCSSEYLRQGYGYALNSFSGTLLQLSSN